MSELRKEVSVLNRLGLHARPATTIVKLLENFTSVVFFQHHDKEVDARSILNLLMLAVPQGGKILISVKGEDAEETLKSLIHTFEDHFGETPP